ncbi:uncharacterized protein At3g60930, chloroplastic-like [Eutrema salsugineum]|uniref:uncharacterized protein At3g60930, chloroplastic-like n=1 Tax=Eutrema salsugineum TaxID=72664 RepID=UPI000CECE899|nr:uncharacterized protein At3g60930, chloroplastic-like [Eutrema salsugineum]
MSNHSNDSLDSLFNNEPSRVDAEVRDVTASSEASISPSPSNRASESGEASNRSSPSGARSPDDESSVSTSRPQGPALDEDVNHAAVKTEEEAFPFDLFEVKRELERLMASRGASSSGRGKRVERQKPDPPGSTLSSPDSLEALRCRFGISEAVEFELPEKNDRADKPPENHFTLYEAFFELCFLGFPIPGVILEYLWKHGISIGQIMPRGLRHMIGILVQSFECGLDIELNHLLNLLEIRKAPKGDRFYISNKSNRRIIGGFPSKDQFWTERFFYVLVNETSVGEDYVQKTKTAWGPLGSRSEALPRFGTVIFGTFFPQFPTTSLLSEILLRLGELIGGSILHSREWKEHEPFLPEFLDKIRRKEEEAARRAAEAAQTETEAVPQADPPSREGEGTVRAVKANVAEATEKGQRQRWNRSSRPPTSVVQKHDSGRKRSATDKGKGVAVQKDEPSKKKRKQAPGDPAARKLVVDDPDASAVMFARVNNANTRLPSPEKLRRPRSYGAMAQRGTKFVVAINELMAEYEADLSKVERCLDEARNETAAVKGKLDEAMTRVSRLEEEKIVLRADVDKVSASVIRLEEARKAKSAEVALLKRRIEAKDALFNAKVKRTSCSKRQRPTWVS